MFIAELVKVAPDLDPAAIKGSDHLQDDLGLDSMDVLNLVISLDARLGVVVPETDYRQIATPDLAVTYLAHRGAETS
ncbi:acyl carrier protein [Cereibacter sphaeroides]|uniref:acyl carrier protein n=1 Tax=Cereibacter sphaeroides TaxID=1063 RepID=UPI001F27719D|nr:acyl carrier protein [Cereibacter sphaeroides]MCE6967253.1 acyl carrier protein [Cereibacter sphaeroides]